MAVTYTQEEIDTLKAAIVSGVLTVSYSGPPARTVTYQNLDAMRATLASMERAFTAASSSVVTGHTVASTKKGFDS